MKIVVIGAGAMGSIYGGILSRKHEVFLIDTNQEVVEQIQLNGLVLEEVDGKHCYHPSAVVSSEAIGQADLVILFVKALYSDMALNSHREVIGPDTYIMTLQNGSGHEEVLSKYVPVTHILIGTTEDNGVVLAPGIVSHGGNGRTNIGMLVPDTDGILPKVKEAFDSCGFFCVIHDCIQQLIWNKLFTNISLSAVTGVLGVPMGYIARNEYAWNVTFMLIHEAVGVAHALGLKADEKEICKKVRMTSEASPEGITSICADLRHGRRTEVDTISGSVVRAAKLCGIAVPAHEMVVNLIHGLEGRSSFIGKQER